jgi:hypothetical protein
MKLFHVQACVGPYDEVKVETSWKMLDIARDKQGIWQTSDVSKKCLEYQQHPAARDDARKVILMLNPLVTPSTA